MILLFGNIFNIIVNEGLRVNDSQKDLWFPRRFENMVSGLLISIILCHVSFLIVVHYV